MMRAKTRGAAGENLARCYLELLGWLIEGRNVWLAGVEVDLVARDGATRVVVEVKCRARKDFGGAAAAVDRAKCARLLRAASSLATSREPVRIDVIAIEWDGEGARVFHYRNAISS